MPRISAKQKLQEKQALARRIAAKQLPKSTMSEEQQKANEMARLFEIALGCYKDKPMMKLTKGLLRPGDNNYDAWLRAAKIADSIGLAYDDYITANFCYFDMHYDRQPKLRELSSKSTAAKRIQEFLSQTKQAGEKHDI